MKQNNYNVFKLLFYWINVLDIPLFLIGFDNRTKYSAYVKKSNYKNLPALYLNSKELSKLSYTELNITLIHELGHIKYKTYLRKPSIKSEWIAETFALKNAKKYLPEKNVKRYIKQRTNSLKQYPSSYRQYHIHYIAFKKIYLENKYADLFKIK